MKRVQHHQLSGIQVSASVKFLLCVWGWIWTDKVTTVGRAAEHRKTCILSVRYKLGHARLKAVWRFFRIFKSSKWNQFTKILYKAIFLGSLFIIETKCYWPMCPSMMNGWCGWWQHTHPHIRTCTHKQKHIQRHTHIGREGERERENSANQP